METPIVRHYEGRKLQQIHPILTGTVFSKLTSVAERSLLLVVVVPNRKEENFMPALLSSYCVSQCLLQRRQSETKDSFPTSGGNSA